MNKEKQMILNIGICDDDPVMLEQLSDLCTAVLNTDFQLNILKAVSPGELLRADFPLQIALLDVQLIEATGIDLAREILLQNSSCQIIFVSGYLSSVSQVYDVPHLCFVLKDQLQEHLPRFLLRAAQIASEESGNTLLVRSGKQTEALAVSEISVFERRGHWTYITLLDGRNVKTRQKLGDLLLSINNECFCRCHISYAVNLQHVKSIDGRIFRMSTAQQIPISRTYEKNAMAAFFCYLNNHL